MSHSLIVRSPPRYRLASSLGVLLALLGAFLHYTTRDPRPVQRANVISYLETIGPFWPVAFGVTVACLLLALATRYGLNLAHMLAAGVLAAYAFALFYTAAATGSGWVTACFAVGLTVHTVALAASYAD